MVDQIQLALYGLLMFVAGALVGDDLHGFLERRKKRRETEVKRLV